MSNKQPLWGKNLGQITTFYYICDLRDQITKWKSTFFFFCSSRSQWNPQKWVLLGNKLDWTLATLLCASVIHVQIQLFRLQPTLMYKQHRTRPRDSDLYFKTRKTFPLMDNLVIIWYRTCFLILSTSENIALTHGEHHKVYINTLVSSCCSTTRCQNLQKLPVLHKTW